jgi:hypothetical protein
MRARGLQQKYSSKIHNFSVENKTSELLHMPVLSGKLGLQLIFGRIFHKMEKPILVWNAL